MPHGARAEDLRPAFSPRRTAPRPAPASHSADGGIALTSDRLALGWDELYTTLKLT